jgi:hypothetical protein
MRRLVALALSTALAAPGCASVNARPQTGAIASYRTDSQRVRVKVTSGDTIRGTLVKTTDTSVILQPRTRIAEPLIEVPFDKLAALEQEMPSSSAGRAIAIGAAAGAGAALGIIMLLIAIASD